MPGNIVKIIDCDKLEWYVGDSRMEFLIAFLDEIGERTNKTGRNKNE